jgi:hypothetical protein
LDKSKPPPPSSNWLAANQEIIQPVLDKTKKRFPTWPERELQNY